MRQQILFLFALLFTTIIGFTQSNTALVGTWKLVSGKMTTNDSTMTYSPPSMQSMKIVTPISFSVISKDQDGNMTHASAGKVKMDDKNYTEILDYSSSKDMLNQSVNFTYTIEGNRWHVKGGTAQITFDEVWERVE